MSGTDIELGDIESVVSATPKYVFRRHGAFFFSTSALSIALVAVLFLLSSRNFASMEPILYVAMLTPLLIPVAIYGYYGQKVQHLFMQQLAQAIGFAYSAAAPLASVHGTFFTLGRDQGISDCLSGSYKGHPVRIFTYGYTVGSGKNARTNTDTVFELQSGAPLPHVILNLPALFGTAGMEKVELEGNFNRAFSVHVEKGKQMEVREVLQPDVMAELAGAFLGYSIELSGSDLYLVRRGAITTKQDFLACLAGVDKLFDTVLPEFAAMTAGAGGAPTPAGSEGA